MEKLVLCCIVVLVILAIHISSANAQEIQTGIQITYPTFHQTIYNGTVITGGTWLETNSSESPIFHVSLDSETNYTPLFSGNTWTTTFSGLTTGWHTINVSMKDSVKTYYDSVQFLIINGHASQFKYNMIIIKESNTCEKLLELNTSSFCPTLGKLKQYDTSNQNIAGKIIQEKNGQWTRTKTLVNQWWNYLKPTGSPVICVECNFDYSMISTVQMITLTPDPFSFASLDPHQYYNSTEQYWNGTMYLTRQVQQAEDFTTLTVNHDRYISDDCRDAELVYSDIMMKDTLAYLSSGCKNTNLVLNSTITIPVIPFDYNNPYSSLHYDALKEKLAQDNIQNCITKKCNYKDPYSNW